MDAFKETSPLISKHASVVSNHHQATQAGLDILRDGGNAADAAVATMVAASVIEPFACGIGGDCHCLFYDNSTKKVYALNGSSRSGKMATLSKIQEAGITDSNSRDFRSHGLWVSVPGSVSGMFNTIRHFGSGKLTMDRILKPSVDLARNGVSIPYKTAILWEKCKHVFENSTNAQDFLIQNRSPHIGDTLYSPKLAQVLEEISENGPEAFYTGRISQQIVDATVKAGGVLSIEDMKEYFRNSPSNSTTEPIFIDFNGFRIWELRPNTMGIVALVTLNILKGYELKVLGHNSAKYIHVVSEATKFAYLECWNFLCDPNFITSSLDGLLSDDMAGKLRAKIFPRRASLLALPLLEGDTSYVAVVDNEGNGCSFICSLSNYFGSGIIPDECGFLLHDRLKSMSLESDSLNAYGPNKMPLHTTMPAMVTEPETNDLIAVLGMIGRWMQPQGQVQVLLNMIVFGMNPQIALAQPRFCIGSIGPSVHKHLNSISQLHLEEGISQSIASELLNKSHQGCQILSGYKRDLFGKGHVIAKAKLFQQRSSEAICEDEQLWWSGFDPRTDGCAMGY